MKFKHTIFVDDDPELAIDATLIYINLKGYELSISRKNAGD
jgi:hypothetical protein